MSTWQRVWDPGLEEIPMVPAALLSRHSPTPYPCHTHRHTHINMASPAPRGGANLGGEGGVRGGCQG